MFLRVCYSSIYFFGVSVSMSGVEKCGLQLSSSSRFSVQRHWGFSIVVPIQISLLFTITHYNTIKSPRKYFAPLPRSNTCIFAIHLEVVLLLSWNVWKCGSKSALMERYETIFEASKFCPFIKINCLLSHITSEEDTEPGGSVLLTV